MTSENLLHAIGELDDALLLEACRPVKKNRHIRLQIGALAACLTLVCFVGYRYLNQPVTLPGNSGVTVANPTETQTSVTELSEALGFEVRLPTKLPEGYQAEAYTALAGALAEIHYTDGTHSLTYRMAHLEEDISGDFTAHKAETMLTAGTLSITAKGDGASIFTAVWQSDGYSFSLVSEEGLSEEALLAVIQSINLEE
ncbi:MAG: hypothetical protein RR314_04875 [Oscillospiraceae bacterium]